jgi:hypothetical protein
VDPEGWDAGAEEGRGVAERRSREIDSAKADADAQQAAYDKIREHYDSKESFMEEDMTGFVWFYRQK